MVSDPVSYTHLDVYKRQEVSRSTVDSAYAQLLSEGYVEAQSCRGYFVSAIEGLYRLKRPAKKTGAQEKQQEKDYLYDFTPNGVDLKSFPYNAWRKLSKESLGDDKAELFRLGDSQGEYGLRNAISSYLPVSYTHLDVYKRQAKKK